MRSVNGRWGPVWFIGKDEYVGRSLFHYGEYGPDETEKILSLAGEACIYDGHYIMKCLDIGANFGCIGQALEHSGFTVVSFEPQPDVFAVLSLNVKGEKHNCALGSTAGNAVMPKIFNGSKANYGGMGLGMRSDLGTISVGVTTLDSFNFTDIGFMKIDVEGFEEQVLVGGRETIALCRPIMYIEDDRTHLSTSLRKYIRELGYTIEEHKPTLYRPNNFFGLQKNVWAPNNFASHNLICRPC